MFEEALSESKLLVCFRVTGSVSDIGPRPSRAEVLAAYAAATLLMSRRENDGRKASAVNR